MYLSILPGNTYGEWEILSYSKETKRKVVCKCSCGTLKVVDKYSIKSGQSRSCGCKYIRIKNLLGQHFDRLTVIKQSPQKNTSNKVMWECLCTCGKTIITTGNGLCYGNTKSCGCLKLEAISELGKKRRLPPGQSSFNSLYKKYIECAKKRNLQFNLSKEDFKLLTKGNCHYCGVIPKQKVYIKKFRGAYVYNGVDRLDNKEGYTNENSVSCCGTCNRMKGAMKKTTFILHIYTIANNFTNKDNKYGK